MAIWLPIVIFLFSKQESLELERFQKEFGFENSSLLSNIPPNSKLCNIDRNLAEEKAEAVKLGKWKPSDRSSKPDSVPDNDDDKLAKSNPGPSSDRYVCSFFQW